MFWGFSLENLLIDILKMQNIKCKSIMLSFKISLSRFRNKADLFPLIPKIELRCEVFANTFTGVFQVESIKTIEGLQTVRVRCLPDPYAEIMASPLYMAKSLAVRSAI